MRWVGIRREMKEDEDDKDDEDDNVGMDGIYCCCI